MDEQPALDSPRTHSWSDLRALIHEDLAWNNGYPKSQVVFILFRLAQHARDHRRSDRLSFSRFTGVLYQVIVEWVFGIEIPLAVRVGRRVRIFHGTGLVINAAVELPNDVILRHGVTIGNNGRDDRVPSIGEGADIGAGAVIVGPVRIGRMARIGANAVVAVDVPEGYSATGNPANVRPPRSLSERDA